MATRFDKTYWDDHWKPDAAHPDRILPPNPYLERETAGLHPTTALDAGCGTGTEALWLAEQGWQVTAADISTTALAAARARAAAVEPEDRVEWIETDLSLWEPARTWDLVTTHYAHSDLGQLAFYRHIASWVAPGGTLLMVGHQHGPGHHGHDHPEDATASRSGIAGVLPGTDWSIESEYENTRIVHPDGHPMPLRDVIVRARRLI